MARRRTFRRFTRGAKEYIWITTQLSTSTVTAGNEQQTDLVEGTDWQRGGSQSRETCLVRRVIIDCYAIRTTATTSEATPVAYGLWAGDKDSTMPGLNAVSSSGDERWLWYAFGHSSGYGSSFTASAASSTETIRQHHDSKQMVKLSNDDDLRFTVSNVFAGTLSITSWVVARALLQLK